MMSTETARYIVKDPYSALTHFIGIIYSALLTPFIMLWAVRRQICGIQLISIGIFMASMVMLYTASTCYHTFGGRVLKKVDHSMIFVLIAGTYTPVCLITLIDNGGIPLLMFVWLFAAAGIVFKLFWVYCPKWVSSVIYIGMGWSCLFAFPALIRLLSTASLIWLTAGGIIYTAGGIIYALNPRLLRTSNPDFGFHEIFHLCVMAGNIAQFISITLML